MNKEITKKLRKPDKREPHKGAFIVTLPSVRGLRGGPKGGGAKGGISRGGGGGSKGGGYVILLIMEAFYTIFSRK